MLIGANDYGFADIVQTCVTDWLTSPSWWKNYCQDDSNIKAMFTAANIATITNNVRAAFLRVKQAMVNARLRRRVTYRLLAQTYSAPIPLVAASATARPGSRARRSAAAASGTRTPTGRATPSSTRSTTRSATPSPGMANVQLLNMDEALAGRKLCENTVGLLEERAWPRGSSPGAVDKSEWVEQIRTLTTLFPPYQLQEDAHPNYWGQLALRNCFRQADNGGAAARRDVLARDRAQRQRRAEHVPDANSR